MKKLFGFLVNVFVQVTRNAYTRLREFVYRFFAELPTITSVVPPSQYLNGMVTITGARLPTGTVDVIYAGLGGPAIDSMAIGTGGRTVESRVPDNAVSGLLRIRKGRVESTSSRDRLGIDPPVIDRSEPPLLIDTVTLIGHGFSDEHPHTVHFGAASVPDVRTDDENGQNLSLTIPEAAPYRGSIVVAVERTGGVLTSSPFAYRRGRRLNGFTRVEFQNVARDYHCAGVTLTIDPPPYTREPMTDREHIPFRVSRAGRFIVGEPFHVADGIGGVGFSACCDKVASLDYQGGAHDPTAAGAKFNLKIWDTTRGELLWNGDVYSTRTGEPVSQNPELYFSPDCTIIAVIGTASGGGGSLLFFDFVNPARGVWGGGDSRSRIDDFEATVTDMVSPDGRQIIVYTSRGRAAVSEPIPW